MNKKSQNSILDILSQDMSFKNSVIVPLSTSSKQAKNLYSLFINSFDSSDGVKIAKPLNMPMTDFVDLQIAGLVSGSANDLAFTKQGKRLVEKMILSDDDCTFALKTNVDGGIFNKKSKENHVDGLLPRHSGVFRI
jgi:hypothetical protein